MTEMRRPRGDTGSLSDRLSTPGAAVSALEAVIDETRALFHRLRVATEQLHRQGELTAGKRGVLMSLDRLGPQTIPQMVRARPVSRGHLQSLVNRLAQEGLVEFVGNPLRTRARLVRLTEKGKHLVDEMHRHEAEVFAELASDFPREDLLKAARVLRSLRKVLESERWQRVVSTVRT